MHHRALPPSRLALLLLLPLLAAACAGEGSSPTASGSSVAAPSSPAASSAATASAPAASPASSASPAASAGGTSPDPSTGGTTPDLAAVRVQVETIAEGLDQPVLVTPASDGSDRLYVAEQPGRIRVVEGEQVLGAPFLDITDRVTAGGERGLLGVAVPPGFGPERPLVFVHYSGDEGATVVSEFRLAGDGSGVLDPATERVVLTEPQPYPNHNGGWIGFDADGMLLIALGDGGSGGDPENRASDPGQLLGKVLRLDVLGAPDGEPYGIPADNPFASGGGRPEILHLGLRNPFRGSIDPATGDLWLGDVGQGAWEEVDVARTGELGLDFGWRRWEGRHCFEPSTGCDPDGVTMPVAEYGHGAGCSVIGGVVYRGEAIPALRGAFLYADYCSGTLWAVDAAPDAGTEPVTLLETGAGISSIATGEDGEAYLTDLGGGRLLRLVPGG